MTEPTPPIFNEHSLAVELSECREQLVHLTHRSELINGHDRHELAALLEEISQARWQYDNLLERALGQDRQSLMQLRIALDALYEKVTQPLLEGLHNHSVAPAKDAMAHDNQGTTRSVAVHTEAPSGAFAETPESASTNDLATSIGATANSNLAAQKNNPPATPWSSNPIPHDISQYVEIVKEQPKTNAVPQTQEDSGNPSNYRRVEQGTAPLSLAQSLREQALAAAKALDEQPDTTVTSARQTRSIKAPPPVQASAPTVASVAVDASAAVLAHAATSGSHAPVRSGVSEHVIPSADDMPTIEVRPRRKKPIWFSLPKRHVEQVTHDSDESLGASAHDSISPKTGFYQGLRSYFFSQIIGGGLLWFGIFLLLCLWIPEHLIAMIQGIG